MSTCCGGLGLSMLHGRVPNAFWRQGTPGIHLLWTLKRVMAFLLMATAGGGAQSLWLSARGLDRRDLAPTPALGSPLRS